MDFIPERSLILNNLGTLHVQENRFHKAIECYEQAEKLSAKLGDDPSLTAIRVNLAAVHAKTGDPEAADEALRRAAATDARSSSRRIRLIRLHNVGMVDLCFGRYASAIETLKEAIILGEELRDGFLTAFDLVYLGECRLFRGETASALAALDRAGSMSSAPLPIASMVSARRAVLAALRGDIRGASDACRAAEAASAPAYLVAWNRVFVGWARRLAGQGSEAAAALEEARAFFFRAKVPSGEIHASLELAAVDADGGRPDRARKRLERLRSRFPHGQGALKSPMLSARLLLYQTRVLLELNASEPEAAALLAEAEGHLIGRRLRDLEALARDLRRRIRLAAAGSRLPPLVPDPPVDSSVLLEMASALKGAVGDVIRRIEDDVGAEATLSLRGHLRDFAERVDDIQRRTEAGGREPSAPVRASSILGRSAAVLALVRAVRQVARSHLPVLVAGETGTGKELVARAIHGESARSGGPFVSINCAALPEPLVEAELFGHARGAFSGAEKERPGLLRSADGGTFLLDEVGEMPPAIQGKLLRVLDTGRVRPIGEAEEAAVDIRYVFATHQDLRALVDEGRFRRDLYYRLRGFEIQVPPLRERLEDLPLLMDHFLSAARAEGTVPDFDASALRALASHPWPGNVRELQNVLTNLVYTCAGKVTEQDVRRFLREAPANCIFSNAVLRSRPLPDLQRQLEAEYLLQLRRDKGGDLKAMAAAMGISLRALYGRFKLLGIPPREKP
jgi:DNA-binding NtrC family response regulator/tetratricopeptide (TPR) repeat protein